VFHQLLLLLLFLFILKKIIFLFLICNIYSLNEKKKQIMSDVSLSGQHLCANLLKQTFRYFPLLHVLFPLSILYFSFLFFVQNSDSHLHLHYFTVCNRTIQKKKIHDVWHLYKIKISERMQINFFIWIF
jgi:hypothetical protein